MQALNDRYWKSEYENLRRKTNKTIARLEKNQVNFYDKTYKLLFEILKLNPKQVMRYYETNKWN